MFFGLFWFKRIPSSWIMRWIITARVPHWKSCFNPHAISIQQRVFETPEGTRDPSKDDFPIKTSIYGWDFPWLCSITRWYLYTPNQPWKPIGSSQSRQSRQSRHCCARSSSMALTSAAERSCILRRWRAASFLSLGTRKTMGEDGRMGGWGQQNAAWECGYSFVYLCFLAYVQEILQVLNVFVEPLWMWDIGHSHGKMWPVDVVIGNSHDTLFPNETFVAYH